MKAKFTTNINKELLDKTKIKAIQEGKNVNEIIENLLQQYLKGEIKMTKYTGRIYRDPEDGKLQLSYKGIENTDMYNITFEEFIEAVEASDTWDFIDSEVYESALKDVGLDYKDYVDPDKMWEDFLEAVKNG